eukprot:1099172-Amphidinium_carterae.1
MKPHTRRGHRGVSGQTGFTPFFVPMRAVENNVLKVFHFLTTSDTNVSNLEGGVSTFLVPHASMSSAEVERPEAKPSKSLKVRSGASHFSTQDLGRVPLSFKSGLVPKEPLSIADPATRGWKPTKPHSKLLKVARGTSPTTRSKGIVPHTVW